MDIKQRCSVCKGTGEIPDYVEGEDIPPIGVCCPRCGGTGKLNWGEADLVELLTKLNALDTKMDTLDTHLDTIEAKIDALE